MARHTPPPQAIGRFKITEVLGRGGMGEVYKAIDPTLQRTVAVKTVRPDIDRPEYLERMMREAQACARLSHPNIVTVYEAGQVDGLVYIVMEYLQGQNLAELLEKESLPFERRILILTKVLEALEHAHGLDVVHRDIKPSNIHVCSDGTIKLMDFGLARVMVADTLTASGNVLGTPHYASPEQLKGEPIDGRTDIYSTGVMAYEMLSGRRPFEPDNDSATSLILKVIQQPAEPMNTYVSRMLPEIESIVQRAMAKVPAERFQTASDMRGALLHFLEQSKARLSAIESSGAETVIVPEPSTASIKVKSIPVAPLTTGESRGRAWWWAGGAAAAVIVAAIVIAAPSRRAEDPAATAPASSASAAPVPAASMPSASATPVNPGVAPADTRANAAAPPSADKSTRAMADAPTPAASAAVAAPPVPAPAPERSAKELFASSDANVAPGLRFRLMQAGANDAPVDVDPAREFRDGDRIRFAFESNIDGYLYVAQQGTSGNWTVLFPNPDINGGRNTVKRLQEYAVPDDNYFRLDPPSGAEKIFVFLSREPLATLPGFQQPVKAYEKGNAPMIATLQNSIASRDLVFAKDASTSKSQSTYIVNKAELGKAVTASFTITHK